MTNERSEAIYEGEVIYKRTRTSTKDNKEYPYFEMIQRGQDGAFLLEIQGDNVEIGKRYAVKATSRIYNNYHALKAVSVKEIK